MDYNDILDTRNLQERLEELEVLRDSVDTAKEELAEAQQALEAVDPEEDSQDEEDEVSAKEEALLDAETEFGADEQEELKALEELKEEVSEWSGGNTLIPEGMFEEYARQFADDIGAIDKNSTWPMNHIDWEAAADELKGDYSCTTFLGTDYYYRG